TAGALPTPTHLAHAFNSAYWWALGIAALSLVPCLMLLRAERPRAGLQEAQAAGGGEPVEVGV
ncbi:MAG: hypothetical protein FWD42_02330, partial [Solirubrobacterales bacterium]|nr:hypothetical protein [Solirubrobacterales bacterium]